MMKNQRSHLMDSNSDMGLTTKKLQSQLASKELPHYYMLYTGNPVAPTRCCGTLQDLMTMLDHYPHAKWEKVYLPNPETVDVKAIAVEEPLALPPLKLKGQEIPLQQNLPQSELKELEL
jgi:hypothetical protein